MTRYQQLLKDYAALAGLDSATDFLLSQELRIAGLWIGVNAEGDEEGGSVVIFTSLGQLEGTAQSERVMRLMLEANALWAGTGGCTLGVQSGTGAVILCIRAPLAVCNAGTLARMIDAFADIALLWREIVVGHHPAQLTDMAT